MPEKQLKVKLLNSTPLSICCKAIRTCWDSFDRGGFYEYPTNNILPEDKELMIRVIKKNKHSSTSEHLVYQFDIHGISRALLQELARHRLASLSVRSTRYTLSQLKNINYIQKSELSKYCVLTGDSVVDGYSFLALSNLQNAVKMGQKNDITKYCLPDSLKTDLIYTINARSLQNLLTLRTSFSALWEFQILAKELHSALPEEHKFLFELKGDLNEQS